MSLLILLGATLLVVVIAGGAWRKRTDGTPPPIRTEIATGIMVVLILGMFAILYFASRT